MLPYKNMKAIFFALFALTLLAPEQAFSAPGRNCRPEERLPGKRCADQWANKDEGGGSKDSSQAEEEPEGDEEETGHP